MVSNEPTRVNTRHKLSPDWESVGFLEWKLLLYIGALERQEPQGVFLYVTLLFLDSSNSLQQFNIAPTHTVSVCLAPWFLGYSMDYKWRVVSGTSHQRSRTQRNNISGRQFKRGRHEDKIPTTGENERDSGNGSTMVKVNHTPVHSSRDTHGRRRCAWGSPFFFPF